MPFLYIIWVLFLFLFRPLKIVPSDRNKVIYWFQSAHILNVRFTCGSSQTDEDWCLYHASFLPDFGFHGDQEGTDLYEHKLWSEELWLPWCCMTDSAFVCLSPDLCLFLISHSLTALLFCQPDVTPKRSSGLLCSSTRGGSPEQAIQGKWQWFQWKYKIF